MESGSAVELVGSDFVGSIWILAAILYTGLRQDDKH